MSLQKERTEIHPSVTRLLAYQRRTDGPHMTLTEWIAFKRRQFERLFPHFAKRGGLNRIEFDRWLERLTWT